MTPAQSAAVATRAPLKLQAYQTIKRRIVRLSLPPGARITERALAEELDVGLAPVRAAMARLSNEGLLVTMPRRGYRVRELAAADARALFVAWRTVAVEVTRLATLNMSAEALREYQDLTRRARAVGRSAGEDDSGVLLDVATAQWEYLADLADNKYLADILMRLESQVSRMCALALVANPTITSVSRADQREIDIIAAFRDQDADEAVRLTHAFMDVVAGEVDAAMTTREQAEREQRNPS